MRRFALLFALLVPVLAGACDSDTSGPGAPTIEETNFAPSLGVNLAASTRTSSGLYYRDVAVGTGSAVGTGDSISVHYVGSFANGTTFDASRPRGAPLSFRAGVGRLIAGFDEGVLGMRVGGRRQLIIPPRLGYGAGGYGAIPGNSILVFDVEVITRH